MKQHITRDYNSFLIDDKKGVITKCSSNIKLKDEIDYYKSIDTCNSIFFPRFLGSSNSGSNYTLDLEYYCYKNLGDFMVYDSFNGVFWERVVNSIQDVLNSFSKNTNKGVFDELLESMYVRKTEHYYNELIKGFDRFKTLAKFDTIYFNDVSYLNFENIWDEVKLKLRSFEKPNTVSVIHGDFCFSNILCGLSDKMSSPVLRCVDPRGRFGIKGVYGDQRYDLAKLMHSYQGGYEYIIYDKFNISMQGSSSRIKFNSSFSNSNLNKIEDVFKSNSNFHSPEIKILQGLIFIGMCSRHYDSLDRQTMMYLQGIKLLNEAIND